MTDSLRAFIEELRHELAELRSDVRVLQSDTNNIGQTLQRMNRSYDGEGNDVGVRAMVMQLRKEKDQENAHFWAVKLAVIGLILETVWERIIGK